jgi:hypothetical protein
MNITTIKWNAIFRANLFRGVYIYVEGSVTPEKFLFILVAVIL